MLHSWWSPFRCAPKVESHLLNGFQCAGQVSRALLALHAVDALTRRCLVLVRECWRTLFHCVLPACLPIGLPYLLACVCVCACVRVRLVW